MERQEPVRNSDLRPRQEHHTAQATPSWLGAFGDKHVGLKVKMVKMPLTEAKARSKREAAAETAIELAGGRERETLGAAWSLVTTMNLIAAAIDSKRQKQLPCELEWPLASVQRPAALSEHVSLLKRAEKRHDCWLGGHGFSSC